MMHTFLLFLDTVDLTTIVAATAGVLLVDAWVRRHDRTHARNQQKIIEERQRHALQSVNRQIVAAQRAHRSH
jgi:hypothetical protein